MGAMLPICSKLKAEKSGTVVFVNFIAHPKLKTPSPCLDMAEIVCGSVLDGGDSKERQCETSVSAFYVLLMPLSIEGGASAQSWCGQAKTDVEIAICSDAALGQQDNMLTALYSTLKSAAADKSVVLAEQRKFLKRRNACGAEHLH